MNEIVRNKCNLLIENTQRISNGFKWNDSLMNIASALTFTSANQLVDLNRLMECKKLLEKNTGVFSGYQSHGKPIVVSKMAMANDPMQYLKDVDTVYEKVRKGMTFHESSYLLQAAVSVVDADRLYDSELLSNRFKELYKRIQKEHPILTSSGSDVFAMLLTLTDKSADVIIRELEYCFNYLKNEVKINVSSSEIQGICQVLALTDGDLKEKCDRAVLLYSKFAEHGYKYGKEYNEFASLGALVDINIDPDVLVNEIIEAAEYLKSAKGFGGWSIDKKQRLMFAAMMVADAYGNDRTDYRYSAISSSIASIIAEEVALLMCIVITTTATTCN